MKKILVFLLAMLISLVMLTACGEKPEPIEIPIETENFRNYFTIVKEYDTTVDSKLTNGNTIYEASGSVNITCTPKREIVGGKIRVILRLEEGDNWNPMTDKLVFDISGSDCETFNVPIKNKIGVTSVGSMIKEGDVLAFLDFARGSILVEG